MQVGSVQAAALVKVEAEHFGLDAVASDGYIFEIHLSKEAPVRPADGGATLGATVVPDRDVAQREGGGEPVPAQRTG